MLNAFRARLDGESSDPVMTRVNGKGKDEGKGKEKQLESHPRINGTTTHPSPNPNTSVPPDAEDEDSQICDLHFIANCQSCSNWSNSHPSDHSAPTTTAHIDDDNDRAFLQHSLSFVKDRLGKDLEWKKNMRNLKQEDMADFPVVDPKVKEREMKERERGRRERDRRR